MKVKSILAHRTKNISSSAIREIFKALKDSTLISLAGGSPASEFFPLATWQKLIDRCHQQYGAKLYQYGITEGFDPLKETLAKRYAKANSVSVSADQIVVTSGAQSAIEVAAKVFLNAGDKIIVEAPTFLASIKTFALFEPQILSVPLQEDGIDIAALKKTIHDNPDTKLLYLITNFQNPMGTTISLEKRRQVATLLKKHDLYLIEDDPYGELRYEGKNLPTIHSLIPEKVIYIGTLSKIFSPGMRVGYFIAPPEISSYMVAAKQATDVHTNILAQALANEFLNSDAFDLYQQKIRHEYKNRLEVMLQTLGDQLPKGFTWTRPEGGMFVWVTGPKSFNATKMYAQAIENKVAYVPGTFFFADPDTNHNTFRLNFTSAKPTDIKKGLEIIASCLS